MTFDLHDRLAQDTLFVTDWPLNRVLLMNDANFPWLILVPRLPGLRDFHDVPQHRQGELVSELNNAARALKKLTQAHKMNVAALGNMVPQLHLHVIARFDTDLAWPEPVWGHCAALPYSANEAATLIQRFLAAVDCLPEP